MLDTQTGKTEKLNLQMKNAVDTICCYLPESGCWLCAVTSCKGEQYTSRLYCIDPTQAKFSTGKKSSYDIADALPKNIGSKLKKAREKADAIEKKYGVRVLIGNEINRLSSSSYYYISTEDTNSICYDAQCNGKPMEDALDALDSALARYPAGFFDNYRANGNKGLRISLLAAFASREHEIVGVGGQAFSDSQWQNVAICWDNLTPHDTSIHHEIFHTVESLLNERDYYYFVDDWNKLNPDGFLYNNSFVKSKYLLFNGEENPSAYFTREYGASAPHEDRACIVEFCFSNPKLDEGTSGYEFLQEYPNLKAKLDFIELRLRECFGKSYISEIFS